MRYFTIFRPAALMFMLVMSLNLVSCTGGALEESLPATLRISIPECGATHSPSSRVLSQNEANESKISGMQVLVFSTDGMLDGYGRSGTNTAIVRCTTGGRNVIVLVNAPDLSQIGSMEELESQVFQLSDNTPESLIMKGGRWIMVSGDAAFEIEVERLCAKIVVSGLTKDFSSSVLQGKRLIVNKIYMTNVCAQASIDPSFVSSEWLNKMGWKGECRSLLCDVMGTELSSSSGDVHTFYVYPNPVTEDSRESVWCERYSRLVIDASLDGDNSFYVIDIPGIRNNHSYTLSDIRLTRPGGTDEEHIPSEITVTCSFSVAQWTVSNPYTEYL